MADKTIAEVAEEIINEITNFLSDDGAWKRKNIPLWDSNEANYGITNSIKYVFGSDGNLYEAQKENIPVGADPTKDIAGGNWRLTTDENLAVLSENNMVMEHEKTIIVQDGHNILPFTAPELGQYCKLIPKGTWADVENANIIPDDTSLTLINFANAFTGSDTILVTVLSPTEFLFTTGTSNNIAAGVSSDFNNTSSDYAIAKLQSIKNLDNWLANKPLHYMNISQINQSNVPLTTNKKTIKLSASSDLIINDPYSLISQDKSKVIIKETGTYRIFFSVTPNENVQLVIYKNNEKLGGRTNGTTNKEAVGEWIGGLATGDEIYIGRGNGGSFVNSPKWVSFTIQQLR
jgi:hypothetical protein